MQYMNIFVQYEYGYITIKNLTILVKEDQLYPTMLMVDNYSKLAAAAVAALLIRHRAVTSGGGGQRGICPPSKGAVPPPSRVGVSSLWLSNLKTNNTNKMPVH